MRPYHLTIIITSITVFQPSTADSAPVPLPPNWKSGGTSHEQYIPKKPHKLPVQTAKSDETYFEPDVNSKSTNRHAIGLWAALPELARAEYRYSLSPYFVYFLSASGPMPVAVNVSMPSDIIKADSQKGLAVAYPAFDIKFEVDWGPFISSGLAWHPFGGRWYTSLAAGIRSVRIKGAAASPLRICSIIEAAKEPPCGNDNAAIQTRNNIALSADVKILSLAARFAMGWYFNLGASWALTLETGVFMPVQTQKSTDVSANIVAPDGTPEELSGALGDLKTKSQGDLEGKANAELEKFTRRALPQLGIGISYLF